MQDSHVGSGGSRPCRACVQTIRWRAVVARGKSLEVSRAELATHETLTAHPAL